MVELTQLLNAKSMIRYLPPKGTAGLARFSERIDRRAPSPPARIPARVGFMHSSSSRLGGDRACAPGDRSTPRSGPSPGPGSGPRAPSGARRASHRRASHEDAGVHELVVVLDRPME